MYHLDWSSRFPQVSVRNFGEHHEDQMVYVEDSTTYYNEILRIAEGGMDVFIRKK